MILVKELDPWVAARERLSPNQNRRTGGRIIGVVFHATAGSDEGAESWMENPRSKVSCHLHFRRDGSTTRMVHDADRAWHAGKGEWRGHRDVNEITLGWEFGNLNNGIEPFTDLQYGEIANVAAHYIRQGLTIQDFVSHDVTADGIIGGGRKVDPVGFNWKRFEVEVAAKLAGVPVVPVEPIPHRVYSNYFEEYLIVTRYVNDREWYFVRESQLKLLPSAKAQTPLSDMPHDHP